MSRQGAPAEIRRQQREEAVSFARSKRNSDMAKAEIAFNQEIAEIKARFNNEVAPYRQKLEAAYRAIQAEYIAAVEAAA